MNTSQLSSESAAGAPQKSFDGIVEVCCHRVSFSYWDFDAEQTEDLEQRLEEHAEERAKECIIDGCMAGELNCLYVDDEGNDEEIRGWWEIKRD